MPKWSNWARVGHLQGEREGEAGLPLNTRHSQTQTQTQTQTRPPSEGANAPNSCEYEQLREEVHGVAAPTSPPLPHPLESLDYEVVENQPYREDQAIRGRWRRVSSVTIKWIFVLIIGTVTGLSAFVINLAIENLAGWKFSATFSIMEHSYFAAFLVYAIFNAALVFSSAFIVTQYAPAAAGSGIPEIKGYLNGIDMPGILQFQTLVGKIFGSIGSVGGGLALGKEGPLVHTGACIASVVCQGGSTEHYIDWKWLREFKNDRNRRDFVTCGCAAGVSAAFRAPVGGVLFALEEITSWWSSQLLWRVFFTSAVVAVVVRSAMGWCSNGNCGHFGSGGLIIWDISGGQEDYSFYELLPMATLGVIGGLLGALFNQLALYISSWRRNKLHKKGDRVKIIEACLVSLLTSMISFGLPLLTKCTPCPDPKQFPDVDCPHPSGMYGNYVNFHCSGDNQYNDLATLFFNTQDDAIRNLFSTKTLHEYSALSLVTFLVFFLGLAVITYGTAVPAGQFVPGIMIGATYGRLIGMLVVRVYKKLNIDEGTYALLGAASFLGGSMRMTVSLCVIMVEITNNLKLLPLIMLVLLISKAVGDAFNDGFYEAQAHMRGIPLLESKPKHYMRRKLTKEISSSQKVIQLSRFSRVGHIVSVLGSNEHHGFPVIDHLPNGETIVIGLILQSYLLVLLQAKAVFQESSMPSGMGGENEINFRHSLTDFVKPLLSISDISLSPEEMDMYIDLEPFVNLTPYIVPEDMSVTKVYNLFRQLGLRHIFVVPRPSRIVGMVTRKDLLAEESEDRDGTELPSGRMSRSNPLLEELLAV